MIDYLKETDKQHLYIPPQEKDNSEELKAAHETKPPIENSEESANSFLSDVDLVSLQRASNAKKKKKKYRTVKK